MPDTETMDRVLDIITRVPHLHDQRFIVASVDDPAAARAELAQAPDIRAMVAPPDVETWPTHHCGTAYCFGGWVLILKGYTQIDWGFYPPGAESDTDPADSLSDPIAEAAAILGISLDTRRDTEVDGEMLGPGIFEGWTTLPQLRAWVAYYKGEISAPDLKVLLELHDEDDEDFFLEATGE